MSYILIIFDQEGCIGVNKELSTQQNDKYYIQQCQFTIEVIQETIPDASIYICDAHFNGDILSNTLSAIYRKVYFVSMPWNIDFSIKYDYALLLGFHGHSKTNDPLAHSFRPEFNFVSIDNQLVGELSVFIQFLECHSIEIAFISGNSYINEELRIHQYNHYLFSNSNSVIEYKHIQEYKEMLINSIMNPPSKLSHRNSSFDYRIYFHKIDIPQYIDIKHTTDYIQYNSAIALIEDFNNINKKLIEYNIEFYKYLGLIRALPKDLFLKYREHPILVNHFRTTGIKTTLTTLKEIYYLLTKGELMKENLHFTKYHYMGKIDNSHYYLLHTLLGSLDLLSISEASLIQKWENNLSINFSNNEDRELYTQLMNRKYILSNQEETQLYENAKKVSQKFSSNKKTVVTFIISYNCNFDCPYCFEKDNTLSTQIITKEMVDTIFSMHKNNIDNICFYGGEPFLPAHKDIIEYIISKAPNASYSAITNGYCLDLYFELLSKLNIEFLQITLDGSEAIHNLTRKLKNGAGTYQKIITNIEFLLNQHVPIKVRMNITPQNFDDCINLREKLLKKYENSPLYFELQPIFQLEPDLAKELQLKIHKSDAEGEMILPDSFNKKNTIVNTYQPIQKFVSSQAIYFNPIANNCDAETTRLCYDANGDYYSCLVSVGDKKAACGKYFPTLTQYNGSLLSRSIFTIEQCQTCALAFLCGGGCGYYSIDENKSALNPNCGQIQSILKTELPLFLMKKYSSYFNHSK